MEYHRLLQYSMEPLLRGIPQAMVYLDDISVKIREEHLLALDEVLHRLEKAGLCLQKKCLFMVPEVVYLGHKIDVEGLHLVVNKVDAIQAAPAPKNVAELKSYVGLLSYYRTFLPNLSNVLAPLYQLLRLSTKWK